MVFYLEEIVLFNDRIINMIPKSIGDIMVLYPINTLFLFHRDPWLKYPPGNMSWSMELKICTASTKHYMEINKVNDQLMALII